MRDLRSSRSLLLRDLIGDDFALQASNDLKTIAALSMDVWSFRLEIRVDQTLRLDYHDGEILIAYRLEGK